MGKRRPSALLSARLTSQHLCSVAQRLPSSANAMAAICSAPVQRPGLVAQQQRRRQAVRPVAALSEVAQVRSACWVPPPPTPLLPRDPTPARASSLHGSPAHPLHPLLQLADSGSLTLALGGGAAIAALSAALVITDPQKRCAASHGGGRT